MHGMAGEHGGGGHEARDGGRGRHLSKMCARGRKERYTSLALRLAPWMEARKCSTEAVTLSWAA